MSDCTDPKGQKVSGAFPGSSSQNTGALEVNLAATGNEVFNVNLALSAVQTFNTMNSVANQMFGIEAIWFRAVPQQRSKDVIFKEYTLSAVEDSPLCIKVVISGGNMPDSNYQYDLMGLEYQVPTEVQIDKKYWEEHAGFGTAPQKKDIVYLPIPNKLYQVESVFLKRGFMEQETTWMVNLIKYMPEASRREGENLKETIDKYTVSQDELFGKAMEADMEKLTDKKQMSPMLSTSEDIWKVVDPSVRILPYRLDIAGILVAEAVYDLENSYHFNAVRYSNTEDVILKNKDRSVMAWVTPKRDTDKEILVTSISPEMPEESPVSANFSIKVAGAKRFAIGDTFHIWRSDKQNFYAKVIDYEKNLAGYATGLYYCKVDPEVIEHLDSMQSEWWERPGWKMRMKEPITLIDGINETTGGFRVTVNADQYIKVEYGTQTHVAIMTSRITPDKWWGFVVNIGNTWAQYNVNVWTPSLNPKISKITRVFAKTLPFVPEDTSVERYSIDRSKSYITNIRLFNSTVEEEKQEKELLSYFSQNADRALILDNSDPRFKAPYISQQR